jgi:hypothetical protein
VRGAPLLGTPKDMLSKALEMGVCFGEHGGTSSPMAFDRKVKFLLS